MSMGNINVHTSRSTEVSSNAKPGNASEVTIGSIEDIDYTMSDRTHWQDSDARNGIVMVI